VPAGQDAATDWWVIYVHLAEGDRAGARALADLWWNKEPKSAATWGLVAQMYGALDDAERAVQCVLRGWAQCGRGDLCWGGWGTFVFTQSIFPARVGRDPRVLAMVAEFNRRQHGSAKDGSP
jgi:hypothetical protein